MPLKIFSSTDVDKLQENFRIWEVDWLEKKHNELKRQQLANPGMPIMGPSYQTQFVVTVIEEMKGPTTIRGRTLLNLSEVKVNKTLMYFLSVTHN
jgi:hypothetical protein